MKISILKPIVLGTLASAVIAGCGGGSSGKSDDGTKGEVKACTYSLIGSNPFEVSLSGTYTDPGVTVKDVNNTTVSSSVSGNVDTGKEGEYTVTYKSSSCSNTQTRTVKVQGGLTTCTYDMLGNNPLEIAVGSSYQEAGVAIKDANNQTVSGTTTGTVDTTAIGEYTVTYQSNSCTNTATRTVEVVSADCTYTLNGNDPLLVDKGTTLSDPGVVVKDTSDATVTSTASGDVDTSVIGDYTLTYQGEGCANSQTRAVKVDLPSCTYTLLGDSPLELTVNSAYTDAGAKVEDKSGEVLSDKILGTGAVDHTKVGEYVVTYQLSSCANSKNRIVKVRALTDSELKDIILPTF
ncbi:MAG TPA: DUF5011 domain-containing protein [Leucothrix mucor]|nr:DUF5011 domain-containing protein [Leucothrix mucor]